MYVKLKVSYFDQNHKHQEMFTRRYSFTTENACFPTD